MLGGNDAFVDDVEAFEAREAAALRRRLWADFELSESPPPHTEVPAAALVLTPLAIEEGYCCCCKRERFRRRVARAGK